LIRLPSPDDFYETEQRLTVIETTNGLMPSAYGLYNRIKPETVFSWIRVMVANRMATDGASWSNIFSLHNSGTCMPLALVRLEMADASALQTTTNGS
jgi:hypothetical protein